MTFPALSTSTTLLTTGGSEHFDPLLIICGLTVVSTKKDRKLALLNAYFAFFKYIIRKLLSKVADDMIVVIINAL